MTSGLQIGTAKCNFDMVVIIATIANYMRGSNQIMEESLILVLPE